MTSNDWQFHFFKLCIWSLSNLRNIFLKKIILPKASMTLIPPPRGNNALALSVYTKKNNAFLCGADKILQIGSIINATEWYTRVASKGEEYMIKQYQQLHQFWQLKSHINNATPTVMSRSNIIG